MPMPQRIRKWTLRELHRLPDDGNKYELVLGELFVTPPPSNAHEELGAVLTRMLDPYVAKHRLGRVYRPRAVIRVLGSEVEPDLMVRPQASQASVDWQNAPLPHLVVEILSDTTRRRDLSQKRSFYMDAGIPEYWIVDGERRAIAQLRRDIADAWHRIALTWHPVDAEEPFVLDVRRFFSVALDGTES